MSFLHLRLEVVGQGGLEEENTGDEERGVDEDRLGGASDDSGHGLEVGDILLGVHFCQLLVICGAKSDEVY